MIDMLPSQAILLGFVLGLLIGISPTIMVYMFSKDSRKYIKEMLKESK